MSYEIQLAPLLGTPIHVRVRVIIRSVDYVEL